MMPRWQRRSAGWVVALAAAGAFCYWLPPFHVVPLQADRPPSASPAAAFDAEAFVARFWSERLLAAEARAADAARVLRALRENPAGAGELGRRLGLGRALCFFVRGQGHISRVAPDAVRIALEGEPEPGSVVIETGPVFGNALRDGTGLLDVSAFPNSQDFNAIATALNRRVETEVLPALGARAVAGARVRFLGCAEVSDPETWTPPLRVVPVRLEWP